MSYINMDAKAAKNSSIINLFIRSVIFWLGFSLTTFVVSIFVMLAFFFNSDTRLKVAKIWAIISIWLLKVICKLDYVVEGAENIGDRNAIVFCKHQSTWETIFLHILIPLGRWVFKRELLFLPFFGWALACTDPIAINRDAGRKAVNQLIKQGTEKLERGKWINFFPEGTRRAPGSEPRYKLGGALLASESGYPVLPIAHNAGEYWPRHSFIKWPGTIKICVGPLIETKGKNADDVLQEARDWIESKMKEISDPSRWNR
jgi:1-acyl-sn-glycerol-3-phosphate acyltransferase